MAGPILERECAMEHHAASRIRRPARRTAQIATAALTAVVALAGCGSLGPRTLDKDQLDYGASIGHNWKNQMLANIVKLRYLDMPVFVDVGQIVSGYTLETSVSGRLGFGDGITGGDSQGLGLAGRYTDRPTITYTPKTGENYLRSLLEPVEPGAVLALVLAGYSPELLFRWAVESVNGVRNFAAAGEATRNRLADPEFDEFVGLLTALRDAGAVSFEIETDTATGKKVILFFADRERSDEIRRMQLRTRELIGLQPDLARANVIYSPFAVGDDTLALQTRSILQTLMSMAKFVDVPPGKSSRAAPGYELAASADRPFRVRSAAERPESAYAEFFYDGDWYWIDHEDIASKRVFNLMMFLTTLTNRAGDKNAPVLTIPTG